MKIKAIIWDLEGVLLQTKEGDVAAAFAGRLNFPVERVKGFFYGDFNDRVDIGEFTQDDFWNNIIETLGLPQSQKEQLVEFIYEDLFIDQDLLTDISQYKKTYKTGLLSNYSDCLRPMLNNRWHVDGAFDEIVISSEIGMIKPQPQIYHYILEKLGCEPNEAIFIDDREVNVQGAKEIGMHVIHFTGRQPANQEIDQILTRS